MLSINLNAQGLRYFKFDWISVWKFIVPYRDPSTLPRQWRTALGIQKSYKLDDVKKEKRRLSDSKKRMSREQPASTKEVCISWLPLIKKLVYRNSLFSPTCCRTVMVLPRPMKIMLDMNWWKIQVTHTFMKDF